MRSSRAEKVYAGCKEPDGLFIAKAMSTHFQTLWKNAEVMDFPLAFAHTPPPHELGCLHTMRYEADFPRLCCYARAELSMESEMEKRKKKTSPVSQHSEIRAKLLLFAPQNTEPPAAPLFGAA